MTNSKLTGLALMLGGLAYLAANSVLTALLPQDVPGAEVFASSAFLHRLSTAAASVFFLLVGAIGLHAGQAHKTGWFGALAFGVTFIGCVIVFAHEWGQVFFLHELAIVAPEGLNALEDNPGPNLYDAEAIIVLATFMTGWILFSISMLLARVYKAIGPLMVLGGLFATPLLAAVMPAFLGFIIGNVIVGAGWIMLGRDLWRRA